LLRYLWMFIVGIVVGVIAKLIYPGAAHMGIIMSVIGALTRAVHLRQSGRLTG
jgi:uncharacterized membrane protein YeaQ/YmgE (transglycosylase-associated protein family)